MSDLSTYGRPFDLKSSFGEVIGDARYAFEQGGQLYDAHKRPVDTAGNIMPLKPSGATPAPVAAPSAIDTPDADTDEAPVEDVIDLKAWAAGDVTAPWQQVRAEVARQTGQTVASKDAAVTAINAFFGSQA
jgi:hypothetical protein